MYYICGRESELSIITICLKLVEEIFQTILDMNMILIAEVRRIKINTEAKATCRRCFLGENACQDHR